MLYFCVALLIGFSTLWTQVPETSPDATVAEQAKTLFEKLETGSSAQRDAIEAELVNLGPELLDHLPTITDATSESLRARLQRIRAALENLAAEQTALASRVTLSGTMKLSEALAQITEQSGNQFVDNRDNYGDDSSDPEIELQLEDVTFWEAYDTVLDKAGMVLDPYVLEARSTGFVSRPDGQQPARDRVHHNGRFRFEASRIEAYRNLRNANDQMMQLGLEIAWEPQVAPVALVYLPDSIEAVDNEGGKLSLQGPDAPTEIPVRESGSAVEIDLPFALPKTSAEKIATLSGQFRALVPGQMARFDFDQLDQPQTQSKGGVTVMLKRVRESQNLIDVWVVVQIQDADESLQSHRGWVYNNLAVLIAPDGTRHEFVGMDTFRQADAEFGLSYKYDLTGDLTGYRFVYETPAAILSIPTSFELQDVLLP